MTYREVRMRYLIILLLTGCATHPVMPYGPDTYIVTSDDASGLVSRGRTQARALKAANEYCLKMGKRMEVKNLDAGGNIWTGTNAKLIFSCVDQK